MTVAAEPSYFEQALGAGIVKIWADLPRDIQELVFETAVLAGHKSERDESLRERLAQFLHDLHPRTSGNQKSGA